MSDTRVPLRLNDTMEMVITSACKGFIQDGFSHATLQVAVEFEARKLVVQIHVGVAEHEVWPHMLPATGVPGQPRAPELEQGHP